MPSPAADAIDVRAGLAGLVAATELTAVGTKVLVVDQELRANLGGQAFWPFGGLFLVGSPEQRRMGIKDSAELAWQDWQAAPGSTGPKTTGPASGRGPTSSSPRARREPGCTRRGWGGGLPPPGRRAGRGRRGVEKEFALSGSEQNPDLTGRSILQVLGRVRPGAAAPVVEMQPRSPIRCGEVCTNRHIRVGRAEYRSHVPRVIPVRPVSRYTGPNRLPSPAALSAARRRPRRTATLGRSRSPTRPPRQFVG